ncbi:hypothetical protein ACF1E9_12860 [Streptomyces roseolus]|uniref:hypothetical protein n=1 Tax=Streptomyces roseolus TaxID=67358 RepID=UPI0036FA6468
MRRTRSPSPTTASSRSPSRPTAASGTGSSSTCPPAPGAEDHQWLGVTFRTSKTLLRFRDGHPYLPRGARLTAADEEQRREFFTLRRRENEETDFIYPDLTYTVSESDLLPPAHL